MYVFRYVVNSLTLALYLYSIQKSKKNLHPSSSPTGGALKFHEEGGKTLTVSQYQYDEFESRVEDAIMSACGKPFSMENLQAARNWLHFRGLIISELHENSGPTLAQQIVTILRSGTQHSFRLWLSNEKVVPIKGILLLVAITQIYPIKV